MYVSYKDGILHPQGKATESALQALDYKNTSKVSVGKYIAFNIEADSEDKAKVQIDEMANKLLTNPVIGVDVSFE